MTDSLASQVLASSAQCVALQLLHLVAASEGKDLSAHCGATRKWILDTYAECLKAVWDPENRLTLLIAPSEPQ